MKTSANIPLTVVITSGQEEFAPDKDGRWGELNMPSAQFRPMMSHTRLIKGYMYK